jgi:rhamnosyltransferase
LNQIAAVTTLYNPTDEMLHSIHLYSNDVSVVYVIDNSEIYSPEIETKLRLLKNVKYIHNGGNLGIANALNRGAEYAISDGFDFLLTMDQDSKVQPGMIQSMLNCISETGPATIGLISPIHVYAHAHPQKSDKTCEEALTVMTSGNLLNLTAYQTVGPFFNDFFIDHVDNEYCLRLHLHGFRVIKDNNALLEHSLGAITKHCFFFKTFAISNHPPVRRYYAIRNGFYLRKQYKRHFPVYFQSFLWKIFREIAVILVYECNKYNKLSMMLKGYLDYRNNVIGKHPES